MVEEKCCCIKAIVGFLGNNEAKHFQKSIENMLKKFKVMIYRMSLKVHSIHAHLDKFKNNMGEKVEHFHQTNTTKI